MLTCAGGHLKVARGIESAWLHEMGHLSKHYLKAKTASGVSGHKVSDHFPDIEKMVDLEKTGGSLFSLCFPKGV
jgi:hypothetical protein